MNDNIIDGETYLRSNLTSWEDALYGYNPLSIKGVDRGEDDHYGISIDNKGFKELVEEAIKDFLKEEETKKTPRIEKYHIKHK